MRTGMLALDGVRVGPCVAEKPFLLLLLLLLLILLRMSFPTRIVCRIRCFVAISRLTCSQGKVSRRKKMKKPIIAFISGDRFDKKNSII